jgi:hypothetical protein
VKPAYVKWKGRWNGQERRAELRAGAKGHGALIQIVNYWPHSGPSMEAADRAFAFAAAQAGYTIVDSDRNVEELW